jgi:Adenylate and Guanylate cyclase catalytic domain/AAA ATPase domain
MMEAVHRYEGTVNQVMGDGIMALFGAPVAHEDHAIRACYAALRMQESVKQYAVDVYRAHGVPMRIRVGLNSGEVVVRSIGNDLHMDYTAIGQTTHLAARMEQIADPGTIRLASDTLQLAEGFVQVQSLGPTPVKGLSKPVEVYELTGASPVRSRLQATAARGLTKFVGRDGEMVTVFAALEQARAGRGQVVAIVGEPGVGKSRLVWEVTHSHRAAGCTVLEAPHLRQRGVLGLGALRRLPLADHDRPDFSEIGDVARLAVVDAHQVKAVCGSHGTEPLANRRLLDLGDEAASERLGDLLRRDALQAQRQQGGIAERARLGVGAIGAQRSADALGFVPRSRPTPLGADENLPQADARRCFPELEPHLPTPPAGAGAGGPTGHEI